MFAESPAALQGALSIGEAYAKSSLSPVEQQLVALAVSEANDCEFCVAAHSTLARNVAKADPALVAAARNREPLQDARLDALVIFARKLVERRGFVADADLAAFLDAGCTKAQVVEVLLGVGNQCFGPTGKCNAAMNPGVGKKALGVAPGCADQWGALPSCGQRCRRSHERGRAG